MKIPKSSNFFEVYKGDKSNYLNINFKYFGSKNLPRLYCLFSKYKKQYVIKNKYIIYHLIDL